MKTISTLATVCFLFLMTAPTLLAQPEYHGCRHAHQHVPVGPLTPQERNDLIVSQMRSDTMDILNYGITLEIMDFGNRTINGFCEVTMTPIMDGQQGVVLDLEELNIDSVKGPSGQLLYSYTSPKISIDFLTTLNVGDTTKVTVYYNGRPKVDPTGFGGLEFNDGYAYNLGIGLGSNPYNYGRGWFPCFDNFVERATYDFNIITSQGRKGYCVGNFLGQTSLGGDTIMRSYRMPQPLTTYLAGVAVSNYEEINGSHAGMARDIPTLLLAKPGDTSAMHNTFADLGTCIDALEYWYGPYIWEKVGYAVTIRGAMEHAGLIAYPEFTALNGNSFGHKRLMSHELAHHWWGNIATLSSPSDMWFKEGNAEYGAHLFTEFLEGPEAFIEQVKDNHLLVMREAHVDDGDYLPLSGIPFENTYGTHTYQKGASMIHNLRGYLGDSLYRVGQKSVLEFFNFNAVNADMYRDQLSAATGVDMTSYFNDWIKSPGWAGHEIDSMQVEPIGNDYRVTVFFEQKLRNAPHFHTNTPLEVTFVDGDWNVQVERMMSSGQVSSAEVMLPFHPEIAYLNASHALNLSQWNNQAKVKNTGFVGFPYTNFGMDVNTLTPGDSAWISVEHFWIGADDFIDNTIDARVSSNHYWRISGILPDDFGATASLIWDGISSPQLDADLVGMTEDSIILVYRPHAGVDWIEYPHYLKINPISIDQSGIFRMTEVWMGDYAFANGEIPMSVSTKDDLLIDDMAVYPNPTTDMVHITGTLQEERDLEVRVYDLQGRLVVSSDVTQTGAHFREALDLHRLNNGLYFLELRSEQGEILKSRKIEIIR